MKLTSVIECKTRVSAGLEEDGSLSLKVFAETEYAKGRTTTAEVGVVDISAEMQDVVRAALQAAMDEAGNKLGQRISQAKHKSAEVAAAHGEI